MTTSKYMRDKNPPSGVRRKRNAMALVAVFAVAIVVSGTYAWTSIDQIALNEASGTPNPGGRVHDDYDGENKDVYAENFGSAPLFVRVSLREYMETGSGAGLKSLGGGAANPDNLATSFKTGASIDDKSTWPVHIPGASIEDCEGYDNGDVHQYVTWITGGSKVFMPTFNMDQSDLSTDASGKAIDEDNSDQTAVGRNDDDSDPSTYDPNDGSHDYWAPGDQITADEAIWDTSANGGTGAPATNADAAHTAQYTLLPEQGGVMTMADWKALDCPTGNFWVWDVDGWAYWGSALEPGDATSLLLNGIDVTSPDNDWYYAIDVVGQFATELDIETFGTSPAGTITADALFLLDQAADKYGAYSIELSDTTLNLASGGTHGFTATLKNKDSATINGAPISWSIEGAVDAGTTIDANGGLTISPTESAESFNVRASWLGITSDCVVTVATP